MRTGLLAAFALATLQGCGERVSPIAGASVERGAGLIRHYGCGGCHAIPGIAGARGQVGPPLEGFRARTYIAGRITNSPDNLMRWIRDPQSVDPKTAMPKVGATEEEARHIAAYLYSR